VPRYIGLNSKKTYYQGDGLAEFVSNTKELIVYVKKSLKYFKKIAEQYMFHFLVRFLYYLKLGFDKIYSIARNRFLKQTVKDKKAVSRFWVHLKEYKQEMDEEKQLGK
jgi:hypothetical protein